MSELLKSFKAAGRIAARSTGLDMAWRNFHGEDKSGLRERISSSVEGMLYQVGFPAALSHLELRAEGLPSRIPNAHKDDIFALDAVSTCAALGVTIAGGLAGDPTISLAGPMFILLRNVVVNARSGIVRATYKAA